MTVNDKKKLSKLEQFESLIVEAKKAEHRNIEEALALSYESLELANINGLQRKVSTSYVLIGRCYWIKGDFEKAVENLNKALDLCVEFEADYTKVEAIIALGNVYSTIEMFDLAVTNYNQALLIATEQSFDILVSKTLNNLGALHEELHNDQLALDYYHRSYKQSSEIDDFYGMAIAELNTGNMNFNLKNIEEAKLHLANALDFGNENGKTLLLAHTYFTIASMSQASNDYERSIEEFKIAVEKALESKDSKILFRIYLELASSYNTVNSIIEAEATFKKAIEVANQIGMDELKVTVYGKLALFYQESKQAEKALEYFKKYHDTHTIVEENRMIERNKTIEYLSKLSVSLEETKAFQRLSNELKRSYNNMKILSVIGQTMTSTHDMEKILEKLYEDINSLMTADSLSVSLFDKEENALRFNLSIERGEYLDSHSLSLDNKKSLAVWSFLNQETIKVNDVEKEYKKYTEGIGSTRGELMYSVLIAPLIVEGEVIGVFSIQAKERNSYTEAHKVLLQTLASYLAISIKNAMKTKQLDELNRILKMKSEKDGLTGIPNRRLFDDRYNELWEQSLKHMETISVMIIDIDNFKEFNDTYGHLVGDEVIKSVARVLDECKGKTDFVARYGGDEFVAILPNASEEDVVKFDKNLRKTLKNVNVKLGIETEVTLSIGVASAVPADVSDKEKLIYTADNQLYKSKADGKNTTSLISM